MGLVGRKQVKPTYAGGAQVMLKSFASVSVSVTGIVSPGIVGRLIGSCVTGNLMATQNVFVRPGVRSSLGQAQRTESFMAKP